MTNKIVEKGSNIAVSYTGSLEDGTIFDATSKH
jgi:FKBP-type peptidyl-prolyl cis-trans isomerase